MTSKMVSAEEMKNKLPAENTREKIIEFEELISKQEDAFFGDTPYCPVKHSFADGIYVREIFIPAHTYIVGKIHLHSHPNFLLSGTVLVVTEGGGEEKLTGPLSIISPPGTKRALYSLSDVIWVTCHANATNTQDLDELEKIVIAESFEEYDKYKKLENNFLYKFLNRLKIAFNV